MVGRGQKPVFDERFHFPEEIGSESLKKVTKKIRDVVVVVGVEKILSQRKSIVARTNQSKDSDFQTIALEVITNCSPYLAFIAAS